MRDGSDDTLCDGGKGLILLEHITRQDGKIDDLRRGQRRTRRLRVEALLSMDRTPATGKIL
jgi:hypothetical protein